MCNRRYVRFLFLAVAACALVSCLRSVDSSLKLDPSPLLSGGPGWVVVREAYARLKEKPTSSSADLAHIRRGSAFQILAIDLGDDSDPAGRGPWYRIETEGIGGWVRAADLIVRSTREQAEYAAAGFR